jgi:integrase
METTPITWSEAIAGWLASQRAAGHSERTLTLRRRYLMRLANAAHMPALADVTARDVVAFLARHGSWAPETRYSVQSTIRGFFTWALRNGYVAANPADDLVKVKRSAPNPRPFPERELAGVLAACDERRRRMIYLGAGLGLRCLEIARVHTRDVLPTTRGHALTVHGKGNKVRVLPMPEDLANVILAAGGWLFPGRDGGHLSPWWVSHLLADVLPEGWTAHTLRHRFGTRAYELSHDLLEVQELLGHASADTTRRYVRTSDDAKRAIVDQTANLGGIA